MYKNILEVILVILLLVILCCCMVVKKHTYTLRILLALVIILTLLRVFYVSNREGFSDSLTLVDRNNLIDGDTRLQREQKQTSRELDVLEGQIRLMKKLYSKEKSERRRANTKSIELKCTPPTAYFSDGNVADVTPEYEGLNIEDLNITAEQLQNLINRANTISD
tara:strand:+ start:341 stop:835 length:495 start_codon:yes stop_codon:yes gene_type:complete